MRAPHRRELHKPHSQGEKKRLNLSEYEKRLRRNKVRILEKQGQWKGRGLCLTPGIKTIPPTPAWLITPVMRDEKHITNEASLQGRACHCWGEPFNPLIWKNNARAGQNGQDATNRFRQPWSVQQRVCLSLKRKGCLLVDFIYVLLNLIRKILKLSGINWTYETSIKSCRLIYNFLWRINLPASANYVNDLWHSLWCV